MNLREIDALVADHIIKIPRKYGREMKAEIAQRYPDTLFWLYDNIWDVDGPPYYTTDIAAAWEVVEHLSADGWTFDLHIPSTTWWAEFYCPYGPCKKHGNERKDCGHGSGRIKADTAPLAICLAALKAMGVEVDLAAES